MSVEYNLEQFSDSQIDIEGLTNELSIYDDVDMLDNSDCDEYDDVLSTYTDLSKDDNEECEPSCSTCYHKCRGKCLIKNIELNSLEPPPSNCWFYRDGLTMRASKDFQDDYDDLYDNYD